MPRHKGESGREARWARKQEGPKTWKKRVRQAAQNSPVVSNTKTVELAKSQTVTISDYADFLSISYIINDWGAIDVLKQNKDPEAYEQEKLDFGEPVKYTFTYV